MKGYIDSMTKIYNRNKVNEEDKELYEAIRQAAYSQLDAIDTDNDKVEMRPLSEIKKRLNLLLRNNLFEGKAIVKYEIDDLNTNNEIEIPLFIYNIVLIELVKNIKRYSYSMNRNLTINYSGDKGFSLSNNVDDDAIKNAKSTNDGLYMCQKLCLDLGWKLIWRFEDVEGIENVSKKFLINLNRTKNE